MRRRLRLGMGCGSLRRRYPVFDGRWIQAYTTGVHTFLGSAYGNDRIDEEDEYDLSHEYFTTKTVTVQSAPWEE